MKVLKPDAPRYRYTGPARSNGGAYVRTGDVGTIQGREDREVVGFAPDKGAELFAVGRDELEPA